MNGQEQAYKEVTIQDFTPDQIKEIREGVAAGIDVAQYAVPQFLAIQMRQIRLGLMAGVEVSVYADPAYDWFQMEEIRLGLEQKLNVEGYASPGIPYEKMRQVRKGLRQGIELAPYLELDAGTLKEIRKAKAIRFEIMPYIEEGYDDEQLMQIRLAHQHDVDINPFLRLEYRGVSLAQIRLGLEKGLDVSVYAKICYGWRQMQEIRLGLEHRVDVSKYVDPLYSYRQMREIRLGLEYGLPVDDYSRMRYSATDMRSMRLKLQTEMLSLEQNMQAADIQVRKILADIEKAQDPFQIVLSPDEMEVHLVIMDRERSFTEEDVLSALWLNKVRKGILRKEITKIVDGTYKEHSVLVACGRAPQAGKDGWYEFFFRTDVNRKPKMLEDGSVDYQNIEWFETVKRGDKLAYYHPAEDGINGYNVRGDILPAIKGKETGVLMGNGFKLEHDRRTYVATTDGWAELQGNRLEISNMLVVEETNLATGNIVFEGNVYVKGNVGSQTEIRAAGDVMVDGFVESAVIESGGNVVLRQGMNAAGQGCIRAAGNVMGKFLEGVKVTAGKSIQANYCLNCELVAEETIEISKANGSLIGGSAIASKGIVVQNAGNHVGVRTLFRVGIREEILARFQDIKDRHKAHKEELRIFENALAELEKKYPPEVCSQMEIYGKLQNAVYTKNVEIEHVEEEWDRMEQELKVISAAKVVVKGRLHEGVVVEINGKRWISRNLVNVTIRKTLDEAIAAYKN